ncbi:MAG: TonB-dependent receptor family protein [Candidatus Kapaibacterium sp.]
MVVIGQSLKGQRRMVGAGTQVSPKTIRLINPIGTQEMLEYVPGVNGFADDGMGNSRLNIGIRGLNPRRSSRVLVLEDGIPIQPAPYIYPNMYYNPPTERIERIEVLKGSAAIEYGPQTMGGVVNYITSRPRSNFGGRVDVTGGTNGFLSAYGELGGIGSNTVRSDAQFLFKRGDGYRENNGFTQYNGTLKFTLVPSADNVLYLKLNGNFEESNATYTGLTEYSFANNPNFNPKEDDLFTVRRASLDAIYTQSLSKVVTSSTRAYFNIFDRRWWRENDVFYRAADYEADPTTAVPVPWFETGDLVRAGNGRDNYGILRRFYSLGIEQSYSLSHSLFGNPLQSRFGGRLHWERFKDDKVTGNAPNAREGVYYRYNPEDSTTTILGSSENYETAALALYAREGLTVGDFTITLGARLEVFEQEQIDRLRGNIYSDKTSIVLLPGVGANYELGDLNFFGGIHRGYTPPSSGALTVLDFGGTNKPEGLDLKPETSWNVELGARSSNHWIGMEVAGFAIVVEDLVAAGRGTVFKNLGKVKTQGIELGGKVNGSKVFNILPDLNISYTFLKTEVIEGEIASAVIAGDIPVDISGKELPYAPAHTLTVGLSRDFNCGLTLRADAHYVSKVFTDFENIETTSNRGDTGPIDGYTIFSFNAGLKVARQWTVHLSAKNITDEIYIGSRLHSNPRQTEANLSSGILPGSRRQINIGAGYAFGEI